MKPLARASQAFSDPRSLRRKRIADMAPVVRAAIEAGGKPSDFSSYRELGKAPMADPCKRCGLSVFRTLVDAKRCSDIFPYLGRWVATGVLGTQDGHIKPTGSHGHHTWWTSLTASDRAARFGPPTRLP